MLTELSKVERDARESFAPRKLTVDDYRKWAAALRSGKFRQMHFAIYSPARDTHCCLGVLFETVEEPLANRPQLATFGATDLLGMPRHQAATFTYLNDTVRLSFDEIAVRVDNIACEMERTQVADAA